MKIVFFFFLQPRKRYPGCVSLGGPHIRGSRLSQLPPRLPGSPNRFFKNIKRIFFVGLIQALGALAHGSASQLLQSGVPSQSLSKAWTRQQQPNAVLVLHSPGNLACCSCCCDWFRVLCAPTENSKAAETRQPSLK